MILEFLRRHAAKGIGVFAVWLLVYTAFWVERSKCSIGGAECAQIALRNWIADLVMFSWVYDYQTLIAGILAVIAASAIFINSHIERKAREDEALRTRYEARIASIRRIMHSFRSTATQIMVTGQADHAIAQLTSLQSRIYEISDELPSVTNRLNYFIGASILRANRWKKGENGSRPASAKAFCIAYCELGVLMLGNTVQAASDVVPATIAVSETDLQRMQYAKLEGSDKTTFDRNVDLPNVEN